MVIRIPPPTPSFIHWKVLNSGEVRRGLSQALEVCRQPDDHQMTI